MKEPQQEPALQLTEEQIAQKRSEWGGEWEEKGVGPGSGEEDYYLKSDVDVRAESMRRPIERPADDPMSTLSEEHRKGQELVDFYNGKSPDINLEKLQQPPVPQRGASTPEEIQRGDEILAEQERSRAVENLSWFEKRWYDYSYGYNKIVEQRDIEGNPINTMFGEGSTIEELDDTWWGSAQAALFTATGKLTINTLNLLGRAIDWANIPGFDPGEARAISGGELPNADDVYGMRSGPAAIAEPLIQFGEAMLFAFAGAGTFAPAIVAQGGALASPWLGFFTFGAYADLTAFDPKVGNVTTMVREAGWLPESVSDSDFMKFMDAKYQMEQGNELTAHAVMMLEGGAIGETFGGLIKGLGVLFKGMDRGSMVKGLQGGMPSQGIPNSVSMPFGVGGEMPSLVSIAPDDWLSKPLPANIKARWDKIQAVGLGRVKMYKDLLEQGMSADEAMLTIERSRFSMKKLSDEEGLYMMADIMADVFKSTPEKFLPVIQTFKEFGGDIARLMFDQSELISQNAAAEMLEAGAYASRGAWSKEKHAIGNLKVKAMEKRANEFGFEMAGGRFKDTVDITAFLGESAWGRKLLKDKDAKAEFIKRARSWKGYHLNKALTSKGESLVGSPAYYKGAVFDDEARTNLLKDFIDLAQRGDMGRYWYEESGAEILRMTGGNIEEAEKFVKIVAMTSAQNKVQPNWNMALQVWEAIQAGDDIRWTGKGKGPIIITGKGKGEPGWLNPGLGKNSRMAGKIHDTIVLGKEWKDIKTNSFYNGLMKEIDPNLFTKEGWESRYGVGTFSEGRSTIDMHMMNVANYPTKSPSPQQYEFMQQMIREVRDHLNKTNPEEAYTTDQIQAMIWTTQLHNKELSDHAIGVAKALKEGKTPPTKPEMSTFNYAHASEQRRTLIELVPDDATVLPGMRDSSASLRGAYTSDVQRALMPEGDDSLAKTLGLFQPRVLDPDDSLVGANISFPTGSKHRTEPKLAMVNPDITARVKDWTIANALVTRPGEITSYMLFPAKNLSQGNTVDFVLDFPLNATTRDEVYNALTTKYGDDAFAVFDVSATENGFRLINLDTEKVPINARKYRHEISKIFDELSDDPDTVFSRTGRGEEGYELLHAKGNRIIHDWEIDPSGQGLINLIDESRRSEVLDWVRGEGGPRVQAVNEHYAKSNNLGDAGQLRVGDTAIEPDAGVTTRLEHNGTLAASDNGVIEGLARMDGGGVTFINATAHANPTTGIHELGHALRNQLFTGTGALDDAMKQNIEDAFGVVDGVWTREAEELFAEAWEAKFLNGSTVPGANSELDHLVHRNSVCSVLGECSIWVEATC